MKKLTCLSAAIAVALTTLAQTLQEPQPIDWRYSVSWDDPNPPGAVTNWTLYASNSPANVRILQSRTNLSVDLTPLLHGAPLGTYALFTTATSALGDVSDPGALFYVTWPGGNGKISGGVKIRVHK